MSCGLLVVLTIPIIHFPAGADLIGVFAVGCGAAVVGLVIWLIPWQRWNRRATLLIIPPAFAAITLYSIMSHDDGAQASLLYLVCFVWIGLAHRQGTSLAFAPLVALFFLLPIALSGATNRLFQMPSIVVASR